MAVFLVAARYKERYHTCPAGFVRENSTCGGIYKVSISGPVAFGFFLILGFRSQALMALTWTTFGILLIYLAHVFILAKRYAGMGAPDRDQIPLEELEMRNVRERGGH